MYKQLQTPNINIKVKGGWCLKFVSDAFDVANKFGTKFFTSNARSEWVNCKKRGTAVETEAPKGVYAPIHLSISPSNNDHIAILRPDGSVASTTKAGTYQPPVIHSSIEEMIGVYASVGKTMKYLGFSTDISGLKVLEEVPEAQPVPVKPLIPAGATVYGQGYIENSTVIGRIARFMRKNYPAYTNSKALGDKFGPYITASIKEFQRRTGLTQDGCVGPITMSELKKKGFQG